MGLMELNSICIVILKGKVCVSWLILLQRLCILLWQWRCHILLNLRLNIWQRRLPRRLSSLIHFKSHV